jgi:hypothetical protein
MTPENFTYWLNGFVELTGSIPPSEGQWKSICEHLSTVFSKITPPVQVAGGANNLQQQQMQMPRLQDYWTPAFPGQMTVTC